MAVGSSEDTCANGNRHKDSMSLTPEERERILGEPPLETCTGTAAKASPIVSLASPIPPAGLFGSTLPAAASFERTEFVPSGAMSAASPVNSKRLYSIESADITALGILALALAGAISAMILIIAFVAGKVSGTDTFRLVSVCMGGSTTSGIVAALLHRENQGG
jgi:hypothetical protein